MARRRCAGFGSAFSRCTPPNHFASFNLSAYVLSALCREEASELLRRGWPGGGTPRFDADAALVLCRMCGFTPGLLFLYDRMRLHREVLRVSCDA